MKGPLGKQEKATSVLYPSVSTEDSVDAFSKALKHCCRVTCPFRGLGTLHVIHLWRHLVPLLPTVTVEANISRWIGGSVGAPTWCGGLHVLRLRVRVSGASLDCLPPLFIAGSFMAQKCTGIGVKGVALTVGMKSC